MRCPIVWELVDSGEAGSAPATVSVGSLGEQEEVIASELAAKIEEHMADLEGYSSVPLWVGEGVGMLSCWDFLL